MLKKQLSGQPLSPLRRDVLKAMTLVPAALSAPFIITPSQAASKQITVRDPGGIVARLYKEIFYDPFTRATGIQVVSAMAEPDPIAQIRTIVETKHYLWDIANITQLAALILTTDKVYLEKHELEQDPVISSIPPQFMSPYSVGTNVYATALVYRTDAFKGRRAPQSWQDFWDIHHFPGRRALRKHPFDTLEIALMADGVSPEAIYPCDLDRAFRSLDKIKPHISVWWTSGPQTTHLLRSKEVDLLWSNFLGQDERATTWIHEE